MDSFRVYGIFLKPLRRKKFGTTSARSFQVDMNPLEFHAKWVRFAIAPETFRIGHTKLLLVRRILKGLCGNSFAGVPTDRTILSFVAPRIHKGSVIYLSL